MNRRGFFKRGLGLLGGIAAAFSKADIAEPQPVDKVPDTKGEYGNAGSFFVDFSHGEPVGASWVDSNCRTTSCYYLKYTDDVLRMYEAKDGQLVALDYVPDGSSMVDWYDKT